MIYIILSIFLISNLINADIHNERSGQEVTSRSYPELSMDLLSAVRHEQPADHLVKILANANEDSLYASLDTESKKKAFWLNIYNAYIQILLTDNPELFEKRNSLIGYNFFSTSQITIAGKELSFDDIEHGIMRRSKMKVSMGYVRSLFPDKFEKRFWWNEVDPRIHFALNCGAASCPPIAVYDPDRVEEQLDIITKKYLEQTTDYNSEIKVVEVTRLIKWFRADFGGKDGAVQMLKNYDVIPETADPSVEFKKYDWTLELGNYQDL